MQFHWLSANFWSRKVIFDFRGSSFPILPHIQTKTRPICINKISLHPALPPPIPRITLNNVRLPSRPDAPASTEPEPQAQAQARSLQSVSTSIGPTSIGPTSSLRGLLPSHKDHSPHANRQCRRVNNLHHAILVSPNPHHHRAHGHGPSLPRAHKRLSLAALQASVRRHSIEARPARPHPALAPRRRALLPNRLVVVVLRRVRPLRRPGRQAGIVQ